MNDTRFFDLSAPGFSLRNALLCCQWSADAYHLFNIHSTATGASAYVFDAGNCYVVAFKGSSTALDFVCDARFFQRDGWHEGSLVDYLSIAKMVDDRLAELIDKIGPKPIVATGHSLGAMLAKHFVFNGSGIIACYTFGGPRCMSRKRAAEYAKRRLSERTFRVVHANDLVARIPWLGYWHAGHHEMLWPSMPVEIDPSPGITIPQDIRGLWHALSTHSKLGWRPKEVLIQDHFLSQYQASIENAIELDLAGRIETHGP